MLALFILCAVVTTLQDDVLYRQRAEQLIEQLDSESGKEADAAAREIGMLPASVIPMIRQLAPPESRPRAAERLKKLLPPDPWGRMFRRSISNARSEFEAIVGGKDRHRDGAIKTAITGLACLPAEESKALLAKFSDDKDPAVQDFAAAAKLFLSPKPEGSFAKLLDSPISCDRGADLILLNGEISAIPKAVEVFCRQERPESAAAARVLENFGAEGHVDRIAAVLEGNRPPYFAEAARILGRTGGKDVEKALRALLERLGPGDSRGAALVSELEILAGPNPELRRRFPPSRRDRSSEELFLDPAVLKQALAKIRADKSIIGPLKLKQLLRFAIPELKEDVLAWARDPSARPEQLQRLLPLAGAVAGREAAPLLLEKLAGFPPTATGAADGLALIGDPAHAVAVWKAFAKGGIMLGTSMVSFPPESLEDELVAHFTDSDYVSPWALQLARMRPTPRIRAAMFQRLAAPRKRTQLTGFEVPMYLDKALNEKEREAVEKMRSSDHHILKMIGHFLAMRSGEGGAAEALAGLLAQYDTWTFRDPKSVRFWREAEKAGPTWRDAVRKAWVAKPEWNEGFLELARWGDAEALARLKTEMAFPTFQFREAGHRVLEAQGDVQNLLGRCVRLGRVSMEDEDLIARLMEDASFRERILILARCWGLDGGGWALPILAQRADPEALPLFRIAAARGVSSCLHALVRLEDPDAYRIALRHLASESAALRTAGVEALAAIGNKAAVPDLCDLIDDMETGWDTRIERADPRILETPPPRPVAVFAMSALEKLTGVKSEGASIADRREFWRAWRAKHRDTWK